MKYKLILFALLSAGIHLANAQNNAWIENTDSLKNTSGNMGGYKITSEGFNKGAVFSPLQLIQGKIPGFTVNCLNSNDPNPDIQTQLRGASSAYLPGKPLYIVNGVELDNIDFVPVESITSIEVLKSISETALYGIRGVDGVVIINTRKNLPEKFTVTYTSYIYTEKPGKSNYMNSHAWRELKKEWANSTYNEVKAFAQLMPDYNANTDWIKEMAQNKLSQSHFLDFSGRYKKTSYSGAVSFINHNGIIQKINNEMWSGQILVSQLALRDKLQINLFLTGNERKYSAINKNIFINNRPYSNNSFASSHTTIFNFANTYNPTVPENELDIFTSYNPVQLLNMLTDLRRQNNMLANIAVSYNIIRNLKVSASYSAHNRVDKNTYSQQYTPSSTLNKYGDYNDLTEQIFKIRTDYNISVNDHHLNVQLQYTNQKNHLETQTGDIDAKINESGIYQPNPDYQIIGQTARYNHDIKISNTYLLVKYDYKNKYSLSAGMAIEKSPLYRHENSTENYLSLRGNWKLSNEAFLKDKAWLSDLRVFAGHANSKRQGIFSGYETGMLINPDIRGEKLQEENIGLEGRLFSNRLGFSVEYYDRKTTDGVSQELIRPSGMYTYTLTNNAKIRNNGWELNIKGNPIISPVKWIFDCSVSFNQNTLLSAEPEAGYGTQYSGRFYGKKFAGYSSEGNVLVFDSNGNKTLFNSSSTWELIGNSLPKTFLGLTNTIQYKNFDFSVSIRGAFNFDIKNAEYYASYDGGYYPLMWKYNFKEYIQTVDQRALLFKNAEQLQYTDYVIEKGDYLKIDNISLSYNIPVKRILKQLEVYLACNNLATFTKFRGGNPESVGINALNNGVYFCDNYISTRIFLFGLKCSL